MKTIGVKSRLFAAVLAAALALSALCTPAFATATLPDLPKDEYVVDDADILSDSTAEQVEAISAQLEQSCDGAQIGVLTVQYTGNVSTEEFALQAFNAWGLGSSDKNNGALILLVMETAEYADGDYYLTTGTGFRNTELETNASAISQTMETEFAAGDYDAAVLTCAQNVAETIADIYGVTLESTGATGAAEQPADQPYNEPGRGSGFDFFELIGYFFEVIIVLAVIFVIIRGIFAPIGRTGGYLGSFGLGWCLGSSSARRHRPPHEPRPPYDGFGGGRPPRGGQPPMGGMGGMGGGARAPRTGGSSFRGSGMGGGRSMGGGSGRGRSGGSFGGGRSRSGGSFGGGRSGGSSRGGGMGGGRSMGGGGGRGR